MPFNLPKARDIYHKWSMPQVTRDTWVAYERRLERGQVPVPQRPHYRKWTRFYLNFCQKYGHPPRSPTSLGPFLNNLTAQGQSVDQRRQAAHAVKLLLERPAKPATTLLVQASQGTAVATRISGSQTHPLPAQPLPPATRPVIQVEADPPPLPSTGGEAVSRVSHLSTARVVGRGASWEKEYRDLEGSIKLRNYSPRTLESYRFWVGRFQAFVRSRPSDQLGVCRPGSPPGRFGGPLRLSFGPPQRSVPGFRPRYFKMASEREWTCSLV
jgi:hypothetical protein